MDFYTLSGEKRINYAAIEFVDPVTEVEWRNITLPN